LSTAEKAPAIDKDTRSIKTNETRCFASVLFLVFFPTVEKSPTIVKNTRSIKTNLDYSGWVVREFPVSRVFVDCGKSARNRQRHAIVKYPLTASRFSACCATA